jgi:hypothetical protein
LLKATTPRQLYYSLGQEEMDCEAPAGMSSTHWILATKLHEKFWDQKGIISLEGMYSISQDMEEQLYL